MFIVEFENGYINNTRVIGETKTREEAVKVINKFLEDHNYKAPYIRIVELGNKKEMWDCASHVEFFYISEVD